MLPMKSAVMMATTVDEWEGQNTVITCERFSARIAREACRRYQQHDPDACHGCARSRQPRPRDATRQLAADLRQTRLRRGLMQRELAEMLGLRPQEISQWETENHPIPGTRIEMLRTWIRDGEES